MAATWRATSGGVAYASAKDMLNVFNASGSGVVIRGYQAVWLNNGTSGVTGVLTTLQLRRITAASSGTGVTPVAHDTNSTALPAQVTAGTNQTVTGSDIFRRFLWSNDEPSASGSSMDEWQCAVPFGEVGSFGVGDDNIEPIVCREGQGLEIFHSGSSAVGSGDGELVFTRLAA